MKYDGKRSPLHTTCLPTCLPAGKQLKTQVQATGFDQNAANKQAVGPHQVVILLLLLRLVLVLWLLVILICTTTGSAAQGGL